MHISEPRDSVTLPASDWSDCQMKPSDWSAHQAMSDTAHCPSESPEWGEGRWKEIKMDFSTILFVYIKFFLSRWHFNLTLFEQNR